MANKEEFDLGAIKELKFNQFKKENLKPSIIKKAKAAVIFSRLDLKGAKKSFIPICFNKPADAKKAFEAVKKGKLHLLKRTALVSVSHGKGADGGPEVTLDILKGGLAAETILSEGEELFMNTIKMGLKVTGVAEDVEETAETATDAGDAAAQNTGNDAAANTEDDTTKEDGLLEKKKGKRAGDYKKIGAGIEKMDGVKDKAPKEKMNANIEKYEAALATLIAEAKADGVVDAEEQAKIDELTNALNDLTDAVTQGENAPKKKLTPERREKMNENMKIMSDRIAAIAKKLNI
jgi:uncharacterized membrane protein YebE (DUF533 family)